MLELACNAKFRISRRMAVREDVVCFRLIVAHLAKPNGPSDPGSMHANALCFLSAVFWPIFACFAELCRRLARWSVAQKPCCMAWALPVVLAYNAPVPAFGQATRFGAVPSSVESGSQAVFESSTESAGPGLPDASDPFITRLPPVLESAAVARRNPASEIDHRRDAEAIQRYRKGFFQGFRISGSWMDSEGSNGLGISNLDTSLTVAVPLGSFENLLLVTPGFEVDQLDGHTDIDMPSRLYDAGLSFMWRKQFNDRWGSMVAVRPAIASDFRTSRDAIRITGRALATWEWFPERLSLVFGVVYLDRNDLPVLPGAGLIWTPNPDWRLDLIFPRPRLARRLMFLPRQREDWVYLGGSLGGRTWAVERESGVSDQLTLSDYRLYLGWERIRDGGSGWFVEGGYVFWRELEYEVSPLTRSISDAVMIRGGFTF